MVFSFILYAILLLIMNYFSTAFLFSNLLLKSINSKYIRNDLNIILNKDYKYLTYQKAKNIFHSKINYIDIYGDNKEEKNLEHIFPQSIFKNSDNKKYMKSDLHNLYLCNSKLNSYRQNFKYVDPENMDNYKFDEKYDKILDTKGNLISQFDKSNLFSKNGYLMISNKKSKTFIPTEYSKGKISRSLSYFAVKYNYTNELCNVIDPMTLLKWNYVDPVDNEEFHKNIISYRYQNNFNYFILNSDLVLYSFIDLIDLNNQNNVDKINKIIINKQEKIIDVIPTIKYLIEEIKTKENDKDFKKYLSLQNKMDNFLKRRKD